MSLLISAVSALGSLLVLAWPALRRRGTDGAGLRDPQHDGSGGISNTWRR